MNIDKFGSSATTSKTEVISKYFSKEDDRDDSLLEFQEKKKNVAGPKTIKPKTKKKRTKQSHAQRDIRNLLNPKRNELVKYSKDFDHLCKQSGIDVDPEQLQLAVVLSKSLQDSENVTPKLGDESKPLSSQERTLKIRKTLQEYGFKVPQNVIVKKGGRKLKKKYKLLLLSNTEKEQIISDRYSKVLLNSCKTIHRMVLHNISNDTLYYKATNISYEDLKNNDLLVLEPLEKPSNDLNLLRSWVEIPGRPASPVFEGPYISFKDIQCSQDQLDILLSGSIKRSHEIIERKLVDNSEVSNSHINAEFTNQRHNPDMKIDKINSKCDTQMSNTVKTLLSVHELERSKSPDMFDDEVSSIMDEETEKPIDNKYKTIISHDTMDLTECVNIGDNTNIKLPVLNATRKKSNDFMEITDCVVQTNQQNLHFEEIDLTQEPNDNNDSISFKHCIKENSPDSNLICVIDETNEDLNESDKNETIIEGAKINCTVNNNIVVEDSVLENYNESNHINNNSNDLVNILDSSDDELPDIKISGKNMSLDDIIINEDCKKADKSNFDLEDNHDPVFDLTSEEQKPSCSYKTVENSNNYNNYDRNNVNSSNNETGLYKEKLDLILSPENDLNQPSCSYIAKIDNNSNSSHSSSRTIILNNILDVENTDNVIYHSKCSNLNSIENKNDVKKLEIMNRKSSDDHEIENYDDHIIFSQSSNSIFSDNDIEEQSQDMALNNDVNTGLYVINNVNSEETDDTEPYDNVDLTQSSNSSVNENTQSMSNNYVSNLPSCSGSFVNLGKIDDKSVDYDEMFDDVVENFSNVSKSSTKSENHNKPNISISNEQKASTSSYQSVSIEIPDKGVNDSTNAAIQENFDFGGISVLDNFVGDEKSNRDSLPSVNVKQTENDTQQSSPLHSNEHFDRMKTPDNEYIVKVDQVTPKPDYEAMSTPEMHRELDKYGVKPFKRKRAIKLLTYIYDQTHPFVESCIEETLSPSKKLKTSHSLQEKSKSPEKSPQNDVLMIEKENTCIYVQTNDRPIIKDIECSPEDWVFQKREKAKIHSCRVPLHIAFHNYVSCRRLLREAILCYEPINIDIVHKDLVASGYKYNPKDLLKFLDKKCITVKTADNNARNKR